MIKNNQVETTKTLTKKQKEVKHIVEKLYKIKKINRKKIYESQELKELVMGSAIGLQVVDELKALKVTETWLMKNGQWMAAEVFEDELKP